MSTGHKGSVRSLAVSDTEHFFLSASKDKTAKLWLLRNQGDGSAHLSPQLTYAHHQKAVTHVQLVSSTGNAISCDGTVHVSNHGDLGTCVCNHGDLVHVCVTTETVVCVHV